MVTDPQLPETPLRITPNRILGSIAFALATLMATGALVAAGLNDDAHRAAAQVGCASPCGADAQR